METCEAIGRKFSIVEDIFRISLGVLRQGFFSYSLRRQYNVSSSFGQI
jgi:hypothetical protein